MRRRLSAILSAALCLAMVLVVALWAASLFRYDFLSYTSADHRIAVSTVTTDGGIGVSLASWRPGDRPDEARLLSSATPGWRWSALPHVGRGGLGLDPVHTTPNLWGVGGRYESFDQFGGRSQRLILVAPHWFLLLCLAIPTLIIARHTLRRRILLSRRLRGLCPACGYDLRGSLEPADACPECGAPGGAVEGELNSTPLTATAGSTPAATAASAR